MRFITPRISRKVYGEEIVLVRMVCKGINPDDTEWEVRDNNGVLHNVRNWWLRQHCVEVDDIPNGQKESYEESRTVP